MDVTKDVVSILIVKWKLYPPECTAFLLRHLK